LRQAGRSSGATELAFAIASPASATVRASAAGPRRRAARAKHSAASPASAPESSAALGASNMASIGITSAQPAAAPIRSIPYATCGGSPARVSASVSTRPPAKNGRAKTTPVVKSATKLMKSPTGINGSASATVALAGSKIASPSALWARRAGIVAGSNQAGRTNTSTAPAVMPSIASEITKNAKWYQVITLMMRVSSTSNDNVATAVRNTPA
jgi:hypothetical protein